MSRDGKRPRPAAARDMAAVRADDALLDAIARGAADDAISWDELAPAPGDADPARRLLGALRADLDGLDGAPDAATLAAAALAAADDVEAGAANDRALLPRADLRPTGVRRPRRAGKRTLVGGAVALAVLSASGVAAAGIVSTPGAPLYPIHRLLLGAEPTVSERAAAIVTARLDAAEQALNAGRLPVARAALIGASDALTRVVAADRGALPARLAALNDRYEAAAAAATAAAAADRAEHAAEGRGHGTAGDGKDHSGTSGEHGRSAQAPGKDGSSSGSSGKGHGTDGKGGPGGQESSGGPGHDDGPAQSDRHSGS